MILHYFATLIPLILLDACWLILVAKHFYNSRIGHLMATEPTWWPILLFYPIYAGGLTYFVIIQKYDEPLSKIAFTGACFGFIAYATYDLTNHATLKNWPLSMTLVDITWGTFVSAATAIIATLIIKQIT
jgi:uncharacterized membrane protein